MPLITEHSDSLPYIDRPLTPNSLSTANTLISAELSSTSQQQAHPLLPPAPDPSFTPLIQAELDRIAAKKPISGINLSRYEGEISTQDEASLKSAYTNAAYLTKRLQALELLDSFGKNAWLVGNSQLEDVLRGIERELVDARESVEVTNRERKAQQEGSRGELEGGERAWREGVRGGIEVSVATQAVEERIRHALRAGAGQK